VIEVNYTLHGDDGNIEYEERHIEQVPQVGELVAVGPRRSYQVIDVLWHLSTEDDSLSATVTACELSWHQHISDVLDAWRAAHG